MSPVNDLAGALAEPVGAARRLLRSYDHPALGTVTVPATPVRVGPPPDELRRGPRLGEDTAEVLARVCRYDPAHIGELARAGAFGPRGGAPGRG